MGNRKRRFLEIAFYVLVAILGFWLGVMISRASGTNKDTYIKEEYVEYTEELGNQYGISPSMLCALIEIESSGNKNATNGNCYGLCQINSSVWGGEYKEPYKNIEKACQILLYYSRDYRDIADCLAKYNGLNPETYTYEGSYPQKILDRAYEIEEARGYHDYAGYEY